MTQHHDQVLGLGRNSAAEEIKTKYRALVLELHPDKNPQDQKAATAKFQEVQSAYETLSDPQKRRAYDATLPSEHRKSSKPAATCDDASDSDEDYDEDFELTVEELKRQREILRRQAYVNILKEAMLQSRTKAFAVRAAEREKHDQDRATNQLFEELWDNRDTPRARFRARFRATVGWEKKSQASYAKVVKTLNDKLRARGYTGKVPTITFEDEDELTEEEVIKLIQDTLTPEKSATSPLSKKEARTLKRKEQEKQGKQIKGSKNDQDSDPIAQGLTPRQQRKAKISAKKNRSHRTLYRQ